LNADVFGSPNDPDHAGVLASRASDGSAIYVS